MGWMDGSTMHGAKDSEANGSKITDQQTQTWMRKNIVQQKAGAASMSWLVVQNLRDSNMHTAVKPAKLVEISAAILVYFAL